MTKPFRFGVQTHAAGSGKEWREMARRVEGSGYSTMYVPDHFGDQWAPEIAMTIAAEATDSINVGALVFDNDYRHPVVLAKQMATLDLASEGRLEVGIGAGWMTSDYVESGIPHDKPGVRISRMQEAVTILKALWRDGTCTFDGEHYTLKAAQGHPRPVSQPHPTLLIGGGGKRMLSIAAREADIVGVNPNLKAGYVGPEVAAEAKAEKFDERIAWVRDAAGDRIDDIELQVLTFLTQVVPNGNEVYEQMAPLFGMTPDELREVPIGMAGSVDEIAEMLQARREKWGFSYVVVQSDALDAFAPVVAKLTGT
jgi:probable F420-dependent oxidoreductase